jgi:hypothetical protein
MRKHFPRQKCRHGNDIVGHDEHWGERASDLVHDFLHEQSRHSVSAETRDRCVKEMAHFPHTVVGLNISCIVLYSSTGHEQLCIKSMEPA